MFLENIFYNADIVIKTQTSKYFNLKDYCIMLKPVILKYHSLFIDYKTQCVILVIQLNIISSSNQSS